MAESTVTVDEIQPPEGSEYDRFDVSIQAVRPQTKNLISALLNPPKIFLSESGLPRDWHGLAQLVGIGGERIPHLHCGADATNKIFSLWHQYDKEGAKIKNFLIYLEKIDRYDIIDDVMPLLVEDIIMYEKNSIVVPRAVDLDDETQILTREDQERIVQGFPPQEYDAFVLFADDDIAFATELIDKLENQYELKLCAKDRDLVAGVFEHESVIKLISERCNRLIVIVSPAFMESSSNKFFCSFAQAIGIDQGRRKIIPCLYTQCSKIPPELKCYFMLDYKRAALGGNFWERLRDAIKPIAPGQRQNIHRYASQNIPAISQTNIETSALQEEKSCLKPKKEGVKFSSMVNLNYPENDNTVLDQNLNPSSSLTSLPPTTTITIENKKSNGAVIQFLKKILPHKNSKCSEVITDVPKRHKKSLFTRNKRKMAMAN